MANNRETVKKIGIPMIILTVSIISFVISFVVFFDTSSTESIVIAVIAFGAAVCSAVAVIVGLIAKKKKKRIRPFFYFILTDILLVIAAAIYAIIDINTDTGFMAGILGYLILWFAVPILAGIGVVAVIIYLIVRISAKNKE